jgi:hypothetical protein
MAEERYISERRTFACKSHKKKAVCEEGEEEVTQRDPHEKKAVCEEGEEEATQRDTI